MKTLKLISTLLFCFIFSSVFSQTNYFGSTELVPLFLPGHPGINDNGTRRYVSFDISEVNENNGRLDLVSSVSEEQFMFPNTTYYDVNGSLYLNSNDSNFNSESSTFVSQYLTN